MSNGGHIETRRLVTGNVTLHASWDITEVNEDINVHVLGQRLIQTMKLCFLKIKPVKCSFQDCEAKKRGCPKKYQKMMIIRRVTTVSLLKPCLSSYISLIGLSSYWALSTKSKSHSIIFRGKDEPYYSYCIARKTTECTL